MISPQVAWIVPVVIPFVIGLLVGLILRRTVKLVFVIAALVIVLIATGYLSFTYRDIYDKAMEFLPKVIEMGGGLGNVLPYASGTFLIGLVLGLWKG